MKPRTLAQKHRQEYRENGRYAKVNPCQVCDKSAGDSYFSHPLTDTGPWDDHAICLCKKCADKVSDITDFEEYVKLTVEYRSRNQI